MKAAIVLVFLVGLVLIATPAAASVSPDLIGHGGGGGGGCTPSYPTVTFRIFDGYGAIDVKDNTTGNDYGYQGNGGTFTFNTCDTYSIKAGNIASGYAFWYWYGNAGNIGNAISSWTWFVATGSGTLMLVLQTSMPFPPNPSIWGGYVEGAGTFTSVVGTITIPSSFTYVSTTIQTSPSAVGCFLSAPQDYYDVVSYWVGIGGYNGNGSLWQAGVDVWVEANGRVYIAEWYEAITVNEPPVFNCPAAAYPSPGDQVKVSLTYQNGGHSSGSVVDLSNTNVPTFSFQTTFFPDLGTVEWIVEDPGNLYWTVPKVQQVTFSSCSSSGYSSFLAPVSGQFTKDNQGNPISPQTLTTVNSFGVTEV